MSVVVGTINLVERFRNERLYGFKALHHEAQRGELTATIGNQLICQRLWKDLLQSECLESSKRCT